MTDILMRPLVALQIAVHDLREREDGQTTTEYAILLGFLAIAIIIALFFLRNVLRQLFSSAASSVSNAPELARRRVFTVRRPAHPAGRMRSSEAEGLVQPTHRPVVGDGTREESEWAQRSQTGNQSHAGAVCAPLTGGGTSNMTDILMRPFVALQVAVHELREREDGQTTTEYAILLGFLAIAIIIALFFLRNVLRELFSSAAQQRLRTHPARSGAKMPAV